MQGLSSRAHAFSVEALVGKPSKRLKVSEGLESSSTADTGTDTDTFTGEACLHWFTHFTHRMEQQRTCAQAAAARH